MRNWIIMNRSNFISINMFKMIKIFKIMRPEFYKRILEPIEKKEGNEK